MKRARSHGLFFAYDSRGNILNEKFYGNLTGREILSTTIANLQKARSL
jgi:hypothetical protein